MRNHGESIWQYFDKELINALGKQGYIKLLDVLDHLENGHCGIETTWFIFPAILLGLGIKPQRSYEQEHGRPRQDGNFAATPQQRKAIVEALKKAGYKLKFTDKTILF